jgi:hypothetical protein
MKILYQSLLMCAVAGLVSMLGCQKSVENEARVQAITTTSACRKFSTSTVPDEHCLVPYVALIANAREYDGMKIYTYAYLQSTGHGIYGLSAEKDFRAQPDFASCIAIEPIDAKFHESATQVYSVAIAGTFEFSPTGTCLGTIKEPVVDSMQLEHGGAS